MRLVVGAALVDSLRDPQLLLAAQRSAPPALAGRWELPGGKVEEGETPQEALHRELAEELGVTVELGAEVPGPGGSPWPLTPQLEMRVWWAVLRPGGGGGGPAPLQDHHQLRWLPRGQWLSVDWLPGDVPLIETMESSRPVRPPRPDGPTRCRPRSSAGPAGRRGDDGAGSPPGPAAGP